MLMLIQKSSEGQKSIALTRIGQFTEIQAGTELFDNKENAWVTYFGVCNEMCVFVLSKENGKMYLYYLQSEKVYSYNAGLPAQIVMRFNRIVNGESLGPNEESHVGVLYDYEVIWQKVGANTNIGVLIAEVLEPRSATGWFAQAPNRRQQIPTVMSPGSIGRDFIGISTAKTATSAFSTEIASDTAPSETVSPDSQGEMAFFQHFEYIADNGASVPIAHSGFLLTKRLEKGKLLVTRRGEAQGNITAGEADGKTYEV